MIKNLAILALIVTSLLIGLVVYNQHLNTHSSIFIFYTSNVRGQIKPFSGVVMDHSYKNAGGLAYIKGYIESMSELFDYEPDQALLLDTGDALFGTAEAYLSMGMIPLRLMAKAGYDAMAIGNLEFEFGFQRLREFIKSNKVPMLAANYRDIEHPDTFKSHIMIEKNNTKIGIIGLGLKDLARNTRQENILKVEISDMKSSVNIAAADLIKKGAELIILLSHEPDLANVKNIDRIFPDVDIIIGDFIGPMSTRTHTSGRPFIAQTAPGRGGGIGMIRISRLPSGGWNFSNAINRLDPVDATAIAPNTQLLNEINIIEPTIDLLLNEVLTTSKSDYNTSFNSESSMGNLITDSMRAAAKTDIALQNSGGIRAGIKSGPVTVRNIYEVLPFENGIVTVNLTGWQIENLLEESLSGNTSFLQASGIECIYSSSKPDGFKIIQTQINGQPIEFDKRYSVAINDFMYNSTKSWPELLQSGEPTTVALLRESLQTYLASKDEIVADINRRFKDFGTLDQTLREQSMSYEYATLDTPVKHTSTIESKYLRLVAEIIRLQTKADIVFLPINLLNESASKLETVTPEQIVSDFKVSKAVILFELKGYQLRQLINDNIEKNAAAFTGFALENAGDDNFNILYLKGDFDDRHLYKIATTENFAQSTGLEIDFDSIKSVKYCSDVRRLFIYGLLNHGQVVPSRAIF